MAEVSWASTLEDTEFEAYRSTRKLVRKLSTDGASRADAIYQATRDSQPGDPPADVVAGPDGDKRARRLRAAFLEGRERAILEFITGNDDLPAWAPDAPGDACTTDDIVRPVLSEYLAAHGIFVTFIVKDGLKWTVSCDRGTLTYRMLRLPTNKAPGAYTINTSFMLDTQPLEHFLLYRLHTHS